MTSLGDGETHVSTTRSSLSKRLCVPTVRRADDTITIACAIETASEKLQEGDRLKGGPVVGRQQLEHQRLTKNTVYLKIDKDIVLTIVKIVDAKLKGFVIMNRHRQYVQPITSAPFCRHRRTDGFIVIVSQTSAAAQIGANPIVERSQAGGRMDCPGQRRDNATALRSLAGGPSLHQAQT
jgi:hypothetical protein